MKLSISRSLLLLLLAASLGGCVRKKPPAQWAAELAQEGKAVKWPDGRVIRVQRRHANSLEGVRLVRGGSGPLEQAVEAERGVVSIDPDGQTVRVTLYHAVFCLGTNRVGSVEEFSVIAAN